MNADLKYQYRDLNRLAPVAKPVDSITPECLIILPARLDAVDPNFEFAMNITSATEEFAAACPLSGLPDTGNLTIEYVPDDKVVELKSLKFYLQSFAGVGIAQEHAATLILETLYNLIEPHSIKINLEYRTRGGIITTVQVAC